MPFTTTFQDIETTLQTLREKKPKVTLEFPNENKDSPITNISICKFDGMYTVTLKLKQNTDLSILGRRSGMFGNFDTFPDITCLGGQDSRSATFQTSVCIRTGYITTLMKIFEVAETFDPDIDPKFKAFFHDLLKSESRYRRNEDYKFRFDDLISYKPFLNYFQPKNYEEYKDCMESMSPGVYHP